MKKQVLNTGFLLLYFLVMLQLPSYAHFCDDVRVEENCCEDDIDQHTPQNFPVLEASCCSDVQLPNAADSQHQANQEIDWIAGTSYLAYTIDSIVVCKSVQSNKTFALLEYYNNFSPPVKELHKLYNQYIVYH